MLPTRRDLLWAAVPRPATTRSRLTWREKLVEFGLIMGLITSGMVIAAVVLPCVLFLLHDTVDGIAPELLGKRSVTIVILVIISAVIGIACAYFSHPYLIRLIYRGYELKDERIERTLKRLRLVSGWTSGRKRFTS